MNDKKLDMRDEHLTTKENEKSHATKIISPRNTSNHKS